MHYQDGITFVDDVEAYQQFYPFGTQEDIMAVHSHPNQGKMSHFDVYGMNHYEQDAGAQYLTPSYDSPLTNQNDLAALPSAYNADYDESLYLHNHADSYPISAVVPSNPTPYSAPSVTPASNQVQASTYQNVQPSKKRKASFESFEGEAPKPKRITMGLQDPSGDYYDLKSEPSPYSSLVPTPTAMTAYHIPQHHNTSPRAMGHQHSTSNVSQISVPAAAPYTPTASPSFTTANTEHSPRAPATPGPRSASAASNPKLVRTSTMPQHSPRPLPSSNMAVMGQTTNFNPFSLYSPDSKARLHLEGSLDDVAKDWSEEELEARRKIVVFEREQKGNDIFSTFKVVSQEDWKNHLRSVSCIWWAEKKEAYVTSVDTISLLEGIVAARFTVEEKNRIRRNLEGFKPDTVSKAKPETEEFFKVIMGFPNPKPRNIEKDVKVFPWKVLSVALQKIISKYSASYASTAASISTHPKMFRPMEHSAEFRYANSPGPEYHLGTPQMASFPSYEAHGRMSAPVTSAMNIQIPPQMSYGHESHHPTYPYSHVQIPQPHAGHYQAAPMTAPPVASQQYWQYPTYPVEGQIPMAPASAPPTAYPREMIETGDYRHHPYGVHVIHH